MGSHNVLLIGGGGREHSIAWKLKQSELLEVLYVAPGNPGTESIAENIDLDSGDFKAIADFSKDKKVDLVIVGPEKPLVEGLANYLEKEGIPVFGPSREAAMLEGSKEFAKEFMKKYEIPTADYATFTSEQFDLALDYIRQRDRYPVVLKADGLAGGKGVFICEAEEEASKRLKQFSEDANLKKAAGKIIVEEFLEGEEASVFVLSDGHSAKVIHNAQDHKRIGDGDTGLNTGGMGAYSPAPVLTNRVMERVEKEIIQPTVTGMQMEESPYKGIIYIGLMITEDGPKVVEYNCRFGDPECQVILPSLKNDLLDLMISSDEQRLNEKDLQTDDRYRCCVVLASEGYPGSYDKGKVIRGIESVDDEAIVFHAGTSRKNNSIVTSGGRVLNVVGSGDTLKEAIDHAYENVRMISFEGAYYRTDIGAKGLRHAK
jgi:phosphoribosylamine---glycine ligase